MAGWFWLIPVPPALSSLVLIIFGRRFPKKSVAVLACAAVALAFGLAVVSFLGLLRMPEGHLPVVKTLLAWIAAGRFSASFSFQYDALAAVMTLVVTGVGFLIHLYSIGYMARDAGFGRYFAYLNLFTFAMLLLVLSSNMILMFVGWEGVGLCSYLLISFWFERPAAARAGKKAFIVNRVGDAGFLIAVLLLMAVLGTTEFEAVRRALGGIITPGTATLVAILLFVGAAGKSAQIPLYVWLPDAMEGPTPVSALIHAATMVTAGVYLVARMNWLYEFSGAAGDIVALVGALTAVFAASMALTQNDIKRILAYSTISQLGYMFIGCGVGAYTAAVFHLTTHAFFKSLLFLSAGSVIHALSGEQNICKMGGLKKYLPRTYPVFLVGAIAIAGVPFFSGFFSKDAILTQAYAEGRTGIWILGLWGAVMTAFYMFRLIFLTFHGDERLEPETRKHLHESPKIMTSPLVVLAFFSIFAGYLGLPAVVGREANIFTRFLARVIPPVQDGHLGLGAEWMLILASVAAAAFGIAGAYLFYLRSPSIPHALVSRFPGLYRLLYSKYYVDEIYGTVFVHPLLKASESIYESFDLRVIDGAANGSAEMADALGRILSSGQTGLVKDYALVVLLGIVIILGALLL